MENLKEVVLYSENFKAQDNLILFARELGFNNIKDIECRMDKKFINFIKGYLKKDTICKEADTTVEDKSIYIKTVDTSRKWTITYDSTRDLDVNGGLERITYLNLYHQKNNFIDVNAL